MTSVLTPLALLVRAMRRGGGRAMSRQAVTIYYPTLVMYGEVVTNEAVGEGAAQVMMGKSLLFLQDLCNYVRRYPDRLRVGTHVGMPHASRPDDGCERGERAWDGVTSASTP